MYLGLRPEMRGITAVETTRGSGKGSLADFRVAIISSPNLLPPPSRVQSSTNPSGQQRPRQWDQGKALAGKSMLNRLELTPVGADAESRYKKIVASCGQIERLK